MVPIRRKLVVASGAATVSTSGVPGRGGPVASSVTLLAAVVRASRSASAAVVREPARRALVVGACVLWRVPT